ncbi:MAG: carboxymuconolactone decarboxylase family protein [Dehalococcoidia bacterium]|nr:carboxymuconolactone decarboxylase family protein [Dehalococcoidia bacterium]
MGKGLTKRQQQLKESFIKERGYWSEDLWEPVLKIDPDFFEAYVNFSSAPWKKGALPPKTKELIYIAVDAATTHLYEPGLRVHVANALRYGATQEEIMEVLELVSALGIHTLVMGVPVLLEELKKAGKRTRAPRV